MSPIRQTTAATVCYLQSSVHKRLCPHGNNLHRPGPRSTSTTAPKDSPVSTKGNHIGLSGIWSMDFLPLKKRASVDVSYFQWSYFRDKSSAPKQTKKPGFTSLASGFLRYDRRGANVSLSRGRFNVTRKLKPTGRDRWNHARDGVLTQQREQAGMNRLGRVPTRVSRLFVPFRTLQQSCGHKTGLLVLVLHRRPLTRIRHAGPMIRRRSARGVPSHVWPGFKVNGGFRELKLGSGWNPLQPPLLSRSSSLLLGGFLL